MQVVRNASLLVALGLAFSGAIAGEITNSGVVATGAANTSAGFLSSARQNVGVAEQNGKINGTLVISNGTVNTAAGFLSNATQSVGRATQNGTISNTNIAGQIMNNTDPMTPAMRSATRWAFGASTSRSQTMRIVPSAASSGCHVRVH